MSKQNKKVAVMSVAQAEAKGPSYGGGTTTLTITSYYDERHGRHRYVELVMEPHELAYVRDVLQLACESQAKALRKMADDVEGKSDI
jgi:hypothetical protein